MCYIADGLTVPGGAPAHHFMDTPLKGTGGYIASEQRHSRAPWIKPPAPFITISRESCAGGSGLAQSLAQKLNAEARPGTVWGIFGGNVVHQMLVDNHLPGQLARFLPEDRVPEVSATIGEIVGRHPSLWELVQKTKQTMRQLAKGGHVILVGRGASFATAGLGGGIHVRLVALADHRARYYAARFHVTEAEALRENARCDAARRRYVRAHFNADNANPAAYDLVINTTHVPIEEAAGMVIAHLQAHAQAAAAA
jgi:cytidylate kinase